MATPRRGSAEQEAAYFKSTRKTFKKLCTHFGLNPPEVVSSPRRKETLTSPKCVSFGRPDFSVAPEKAAKHVFGHWLCDLHQCPDMGDKVADLIAAMVDRIEDFESGFVQGQTEMFRS